MATDPPEPTPGVDRQAGGGNLDQHPRPKLFHPQALCDPTLSDSILRMGKRIPLETVYRPSPRMVMKRLHQAVSLLALYAANLVVGSPEWLTHKRAVKAAQMRRYRARKAGKA